MNRADPDMFRCNLVRNSRVPLVAHATVRMMSPPIEANNASNPGPGNNGEPTDPGAPMPSMPLPICPWWDPTCASCPDGVVSPGCRPEVCGGA